MIKVESNIEEVLLRISKPLKFRPGIFEDMAEVVRKDIEQNLQQGKGVDGQSLAPKKRGGRLFYQSGELLNSVIKNRTGEGWEVTIAENRFQIAKYLQLGTSKMPARPFFWPVSQKSVTEIESFISSRDFDSLFEL